MNERDKAVIQHWGFPEDQEATEVYTGLYQDLGDLFEDILQDRLPVKRLQAYFDSFESLVPDRLWALLRVFHDGQVFRRSPAAACLNTALLCWAYAQGGRWETGRQLELVRAALVHDVGMLFVPAAITQKPGSITSAERAVIQAHPSVSLEWVRRWNLGSAFENVALQHHEEWQGQGYPKGLKGREPEESSRIVGVAMNFSALVTQRHYRNSLVGYVAMKEIIGAQNRRFDPEVVRSFVSALGLHPPGSIVLLSDGSIGRVLEPNVGYPLRPRVRVLIDSAGQEFRQDRGARLDLKAAPSLFIARPVNFNDLLSHA